jgi:hypothetical protein
VASGVMMTHGSVSDGQDDDPLFMAPPKLSKER